MYHLNSSRTSSRRHHESPILIYWLFQYFSHGWYNIPPGIFFFFFRTSPIDSDVRRMSLQTNDPFFSVERIRSLSRYALPAPLPCAEYEIKTYRLRIKIDLEMRHTLIFGLGWIGLKMTVSHAPNQLAILLPYLSTNPCLSTSPPCTAPIDQTTNKH